MAKATRAEPSDHEQRRQRVQNAQPTRKALPKAASEGELAKGDDTSVMAMAKRSEKAAPVAAGLCSTCGARKAPAALFSQCGAARATTRMPAGPAEDPKTARIREPILSTLLDLEKSNSGSDKETNRKKLGGHFEKVSLSLAEPFQGMLLRDPRDPVAVTFRRVLANDPLKGELIDVLEKKYKCTPAPPSSAAEPPPDAVARAPAAQQSMTLPVLHLSDEAAFDAFHAGLELVIDQMRQACDGIVTDNVKATKAKLLRHVSLLKEMLPVAKKLKIDAFAKTDAAQRAKAIKAAGDAYTTPFVLSFLWSLYINIALVTDAADAKGVASMPAGRNPWAGSPLDKQIRAFEDDSDLRALTQAALYADVEGMNKAFPAARSAYGRHVQSLDAWKASIELGAARSTRVIQAANIVMIAISIYNVWKAPVVPEGGGPPEIVGLLPGGVALGSRVSAASLASLVESIRRLIAIGALDGAVVGSVGMLGGGPDISMPELQRPTSLSVKGPGKGTSPQSSQSTGTPATKVVNEFPRKNLRGVSLKWLLRNKPSGWRQEPAENGQGWRWMDENGTERLRFMRPNGKNPVASQWSRQANGYFRWQNAAGDYLDVDGNVVSNSSKQFQELTHIMYEGL